MKPLVFGASGRMGQELCHIFKSEGWDVVAIDRVAELSAVGHEQLDVVIDFSHADVTKDLIAWCEEHELPLVSGTTGLNEMSFKALERLSQKVAVLWSANMSLGVAVVKTMLASFAELKDYDFQIEEIHHRHKKDKPSGTALALQQTLEKAVGKTLPAPVSVRAGEIFGIHRVSAYGDEEVIQIEHSALNRKVFARGAAAAAHWIINQPKGFYTVEDMVRKRS